MSALTKLTRMLCFALPIALFTLLGGCAAIIRNDGNTQNAAAEAELRALIARVDWSNYRHYGFQSRAEVEQATLGLPLPVMYESLDRLAGFQPGDEVGKFISSPDQIYYPVLVRGSTRSAIVISATGPNWYGDGTQSDFVFLDGLRTRAAAALSVDRSELFLLRVPDFNEQFLATWSRGSLVLIAVHDDSFAALKEGQIASAQDVLTRLGAYARQLKAKPAH